jgi:hypothetical protein
VSFTLLQSNVPGLSGMTSCIDSSAGAQRGAFFRVGTDSTNGASPLLVQAPLFVPATVTLCWSSVSNRTYFIERSTNLRQQPAFSLLRSNISGLPGTTIFTDTKPPTSGTMFYRVGVQP